jgi:hypothetical protein
MRLRGTMGNALGSVPGLPDRYRGLEIVRAQPGTEPGREHLMVVERGQHRVYWDVPSRSEEARVQSPLGSFKEMWARMDQHKSMIRILDQLRPKEPK